MQEVKKDIRPQTSPEGLAAEAARIQDAEVERLLGGMPWGCWLFVSNWKFTADGCVGFQWAYGELDDWPAWAKWVFVRDHPGNRAHKLTSKA